MKLRLKESREAAKTAASSPNNKANVSPRGRLVTIKAGLKKSAVSTGKQRGYPHVSHDPELQLESVPVGM